MFWPVNLYSLFVYIEHSGDESPKELPPCFLSAHFPITLHPRPGLFPSHFPPKPCTYSSPPSKAYVNLLRSVSRTIFGASTDREAVHTAVSFSLQLPLSSQDQTPRSALTASPLFSYTLSICSSLNVSDQISNPHKTGEIIQTLSAPTNTLFYTLCIALLICCYMFRHNCHLQGAYRTVSQWSHIPNVQLSVTIQYLYCYDTTIVLMRQTGHNVQLQDRRQCGSDGNRYTCICVEQETNWKGDNL
jgi:hypothetical protein